MFLYLTLYIQNILGYSALTTGFAFLPVTLGIMMGAVTAQQLAERVGVRWFIAGGLALVGLGLLLMNGLLLVINPEFAAKRWAWELNPLDARMVSAWFLGWSAWSGTMAFARDWDEIRTAARLFILNGVALLAVTAVFRDDLLPGRGTGMGFAVGLTVLTVTMAAFHVLHDRRRPADRSAAVELSYREG